MLTCLPAAWGAPGANWAWLQRGSSWGVPWRRAGLMMPMATSAAGIWGWIQMSDRAGCRWHLVLPCSRISEGKARRLDAQHQKVQKYYIHLPAELKFHLDVLFSPHSLKKIVIYSVWFSTALWTTPRSKVRASHFSPSPCIQKLSEITSLCCFCYFTLFWDFSRCYDLISAAVLKDDLFWRFIPWATGEGNKGNTFYIFPSSVFYSLTNCFLTYLKLSRPKCYLLYN